MSERYEIKALNIGFSALQRAENSSIRPDRAGTGLVERFSALQRAENSSIRIDSATRPNPACFSALQRAENSSIQEVRRQSIPPRRVSVLFSEPKIPQ